MNFIQGNKLFNQHLDKVLLTLASAYLIGTVAWLSYQNKLPFLSVASDSQGLITPTESLSESDIQFIAYLQRSLANLDNQKTLAQQPSNPSPDPVAIQTPATINPPPPAKTIERIYIPIYTQNQASNPTNPIPVNPIANAPLPPPPVNLPTTVAPEIPQLSTIPALTPEAASTPSPSPEVATAPSGSTLVGLLESGDRSSALFQSNGITKRIQLGESIDGNGWNLVGVQNQQAIIHRNGITRSIDVGQTF